MNLATSIAYRGAAALMICAAVPTVAPSSVSAATDSHTGSGPAVHMQLKDIATGTLVCSAYSTPASSPPVATDCPTGTWTEQLFDRDWRQINDNTTVTVGDDGGGGVDPEPSSHTGSGPAVHMQLKDIATGTLVCSAYSTPASSPPVATDCPTGTWTEQLFDRDWRQINDNTTVTVGDDGGGGVDPEPSSHTGSGPAVHMQLKDIATGTLVCSAYSTPASSPPVATDCPTGTWTEQLFDRDWRQINDNTTVTVGDDGGGGVDPEPSADYERIFTESFSGSSLSSRWETPAWPGTYRDAQFLRDQCVVEDDQLTVKASLSGNEVESCYAISSETFGPGEGQLRVQYRVDVSRVQAEGGWFAAWMNTLSDGGDPYDGNPATGTEIDVMEYVPFDGDYAYSSNGIDTRNSFHPAVHIEQNDGGGIIAPGTNGNGFYDADRLGIDIQSGWHTFGLEWSADCQVFSIDGQAIWTNRDGVSSADVHHLMLTMEMSDSGDSGYNQWGFASGDFADNLRNSPAEAQVDWVTVDAKSTPDSGLCNG